MVIHAISGGSQKTLAEKKKKKKQEKQQTLRGMEKHLADCKTTDLLKVYNLRQAFPLSTTTGHRSAAMLPEKLHCASCRNLIMRLVDEETEFYACKSCWEIGIAIGICARCGAPTLRPLSARSRNSGGEPREMLIPTVKSGASLEPPQSRHSQRSNRSLSGSEEEEELAGNRQIFSRIHTDVSRQYLRKNYTRRQSDPGSPTGEDSIEAQAEMLNRRCSAADAQQRSQERSRPGSKQQTSRPGSKQHPSRQGSKESTQDVKLPNGVWSVTIQEGSGKKQKTRREERHLHFHPDGTIEGSASHEGTVKGLVKRPDVEWTENHSWGSMLVKVKFHRTEPWLLEGHFETSDATQGKITLVHERLKSMVDLS